MTRPIRQLPFPLPAFAAACALSLLAFSLAAQEPAEEDPFGKKVEAGKGDPAAKAPAGGAPSIDRARIQGVLKDEPLALRHLRESAPTTPDQLMAAVEITLNFRSFADCKAYLKKFLEAKPDDATMSGIAARRGTDLFLRLHHQKDVQPEGSAVATAVLTAADKVAKDPARITRLIGQLSDADASKRELAASDLAQAGVNAVPPLVALLGDPARTKEVPAAQQQLIRLKVVSEMPLLAALDSADETQRAHVITTLGYFGSRKSVPYLVRPAVDSKEPETVRAAAQQALQRLIGGIPTAAEAEKYLQRRLKTLLAEADVLSQDLADVVEVWKWDAAQKGPVPLILPRSDANLFLAARLADDLQAVAPRPEFLRLRVMTRLELDKITSGLDKPLPRGAGSAFELGSQAGEDEMNVLLAEAAKQIRLAAAVAACEVLGEIGHAKLLQTSDGRESPLAQLLLHPDHRLRFAAAMATVKLNPSASFPGASRVTDALAYYAATSGFRRVLIGHPRANEGQNLVGFMNEIDYEAEATYTGRGLMHFAVAGPDYDFILISDAIDGPPITELVQLLRKDFRTARLPIGVMALGDRLDRMKDVFADDPLTTVFPRIHDSEMAGYEVTRLVALAGRNLITPDERVDQASQALDALAFLAERSEPQPVYDLVRHEAAVIKSLTAPGLSAAAARVVGKLATPKCQTALVDFVSQHERPIADRQAAAAAFADAVALRGILLTKSQILLQYDRYNSSATLDKPTQAVLGQVLDALETKKTQDSKSPK